MPRAFARLVIQMCAVGLGVGCSAAPVKDDRPLPVDNPRAQDIVWLVKASEADLQKASRDELRKRYAPTYTRKGDTAYGTAFWNISTDYREFELNGTRHRSKCSVHGFPYKEFPQYVHLSVSCDLDSYGSRFGRGGIHNLHDFSRGWNPEQGLHLAHELITEIVRVVAPSDDSLIRLRRFQTYEQEVELIRAREAQKPNYTVDPDARKSGARGSP